MGPPRAPQSAGPEPSHGASRIHDPLRQKRDHARLLDFRSLLPEVPLRLEPPAIVSARPGCNGGYVLLERGIDLGAERRQAGKGIEETRLDLLVVLRDPLRGVV